MKKLNNKDKFVFKSNRKRDLEFLLSINNSVFTFGTHCGELMFDVPESYLVWIYYNFNKESFVRRNVEKVLRLGYELNRHTSESFEEYVQSFVREHSYGYDDAGDRHDGGSVLDASWCAFEHF